MSDPRSQPPSRRKSRPGPDPASASDPLSYVVDRRKIVFAVGFGVVTAAGARHLETPRVLGQAAPTSAVSTAASSDGDESVDAVTSDTSGETSVDQPGTSGPFDAPILDASKRLAPGQSADVVFTGGRIIDPETGFDRIGNVALLGTTIVEISDQPIAATREIPASNLVISPGFIDMLSHEPNGYGEWWKVADGVTTNVGLHGIRQDATAFYDEWTSAGVPVNLDRKSVV